LLGKGFSDPKKRQNVECMVLPKVAIRTEVRKFELILKA